MVSKNLHVQIMTSVALRKDDKTLIRVIENIIEDRDNSLKGQLKELLDDELGVSAMNHIFKDVDN